MKKTENRTPFIFGAIPHSVLDLSNRLQATPSKLLIFLARKTLSFRKGSVVLRYRDISEAIGVCWRTVARAAKKLSKQGYVVREKMKGGTYKWWVPLRPDEVVGKLDGNFLVREIATPPHDKNVISPMTDRSYPPMTAVSWDQMFDRSASEAEIAGENLCVEPVENQPLKKDLKETLLKKKQHQCAEEAEVSELAEQEPKPAARSADEPLYKFCLRELKRYGVSQRMARKLCREHDHDLIRDLLKTVPELSGVKNVAGYLVTAIRDGGYSSCGRQAEQESSPPVGQKNGHQVSGGRSNYAHLTDHNVKSGCHKSVKDPVDSPIAYRSVEETRREQESLERQRLEKEDRYREQAQTLAGRFRALSADVKDRLKALAAVRLEEMLPMTGKREEMKRDPAFRRIANRSVLETFFERLDLGLGEKEALVGLC